MGAKDFLAHDERVYQIYNAMNKSYRVLLVSTDEVRGVG
jgi:hypothetical protein